VAALRLLLAWALVYAALAGVVVAAGRWSPPPRPPPVEGAPARVIAVPPRPDGVAPAAGEGGAAEELAYTEAGCRAMKGELRGLCFQQLARQRAPDDRAGALLACAELAGEARDECTSDVAELHARTDRAAALALCPGIATPKWRDQCVFGVALALSRVDPAAAFRLCDDAGRWTDFCRHDVNGEIAQVDAALAFAHCAAEEGDLLRRKSCWHGIGKYIARVDVAGAFHRCATVPLGPDGLYRENCFHGLGWGAAETAGRDFAARCAEAGPQRDSCVLGVAYNLRRFDPAGAVSLCESVAREDLQAQCNRFVQDGRL
jgi:hypothetical protein